jgi:hypothetical protein
MPRINWAIAIAQLIKLATGNRRQYYEKLNLDTAFLIESKNLKHQQMEHRQEGRRQTIGICQIRFFNFPNQFICRKTCFGDLISFPPDDLDAAKNNQSEGKKVANTKTKRMGPGRMQVWESVY